MPIDRDATLRIRPQNFLEDAHSRFVPPESDVVAVITLGASNEVVLQLTQEVDGEEMAADLSDLDGLDVTFDYGRTFLTSENGEVIWNVQDPELGEGEIKIYTDGDLGGAGTPGQFPIALVAEDGGNGGLVVFPSAGDVFIVSKVLG